MINRKKLGYMLGVSAFAVAGVVGISTEAAAAPCAATSGDQTTPCEYAVSLTGDVTIDDAVVITLQDGFVQGGSKLIGKADNEGDVVVDTTFTSDAVIGNTANTLDNLTINAGKALTLGAGAEIGVETTVNGTLNTGTQTLTSAATVLGENGVVAITGASGSVAGTINGDGTHGFGTLDINEDFTTNAIIGGTKRLGTTTIADTKVFTVGHAVSSDAITFEGATAEANVTASVTVTGDLNGSAAGNGILDIGEDVTVAGQIGNTGALAKIEVLNGKTLTIQPASGGLDSVVNANNISVGTGASGILLLDGANKAVTLQGATTLYDGAKIDINDDTKTITLAGTIDGNAANKGILDVDASATTTGVIGGKFALEDVQIAGSQTLTVGANLTSEAITLGGASATLTTGADNVTITGPINGDSLNHGDVTINSSNVTIDGVIGGTEINELKVNEAKSVNVSNAITTNGAIDIDGTFKNTATAVAGIAVNATGDIDVKATTGVLDLASKLDINTGNITLGDGSTVILRGDGTATYIDNQAGGHVVQSGDLTINPQFTGALADGTAVKVVDMGSGGGNFNVDTSNITVTDNSGFLDYAVAKADSDTELHLTVNYADANTVVSTPAFGNALDAAGTIISSDGDLFNALVNADAAATADIAEKLAPDVTGGSVAAAVSAGTGAGQSISTRIASVRSDEAGVVTGNAFAGGDFWAQAFGGMADQDDRDGIAGYEADTVGVAAGYDAPVSDNFRAGVAVNYAYSDIDSDSVNDASSDVDSYGLTVYGSYDAGNDIYVDGQVGYAINNVEGDRLDALNNRLTSDYDADQYRLGVEVGRAYMVDQFNVTPYFALDYIHVNPDDYTEGGNGLTLRVDADSQSILNLRPGVKVDGEYALDNGYNFKPEFRLAYQYDAVADEFQTSSTFTANNATFVSKGADVAESAAILGLGFTWEDPANAFTFGIDYDAEFRSDFVGQSAAATARWAF